jgi:hypothetical protein
MSDLATALEPEVPKEEIEAANAELPNEGEEAEVKAEEKQEAKQEEEKAKFVPHQALHEERERRKALAAELAQTKQQMAVFNDRLQQLYQVKQQENAPQFRNPETDPDPLQAMQHNMALLARQNDEMRQAMMARGQQEQQSAQQAHQAQQLIEWGQANAAEFKQQAPDWDDAYAHIRTVRAKELQAMGYRGANLENALKNDEFGVLVQSYQQGRNPAEMVYALAQAAGYAKKASGEQKIEQIQKGQGASKTLGNGSGGSGMPTPEQIAAMSEDDFAAFKSKLAKQGKSISDVL